jgi:cyclophilin family peptidyl-prolyl cis-trans isomerase
MGTRDDDPFSVILSNRVAGEKFPDNHGNTEENMKTSWRVICAALAVGAGIISRAQTTTSETTTRSEPATNQEHLVVIIKTSQGDIKAELFQDKAPLTVKNFLQYVDDKSYNGTIFHRVIDGFMIQGGGFSKEFVQKPTHAPVKNEAANGLKNQRGAVAMARTSDIDSATSQFFINVADNAFLDHKSPTPQGFGYCVFGKVIEGMDVVDKIKSVATTSRGLYQNVPVEAVEIIEIRRSP